jgi:hypothetical protein
MTEATDGMGDEDLLPLKINMTSLTGGEVWLNGERIERQIAGVHLKAGFGEPSEAVLVLGPRASTGTFEGLARVAIGEPPDPGPAAAAFLSAIDPEILEQTALNRIDLDPGPHGLTKTMLRQLVEWANGRP